MKVAELTDEADDPIAWDILKKLVGSKDVWVVQGVGAKMDGTAWKIASLGWEKGTHGYLVTVLKPTGALGGTFGFSPRLLNAAKIVESHGHYLLVVMGGTKPGPDTSKWWTWEDHWVYQKPVTESPVPQL
jgi:hypothetical protein